LRTGLAASLILVSVALAGCGGDGGEPQTVTAGYAFGADIGDTGDRIAFRHAAEAAGVKVNYRDMGGSENAVTGLARGDVALASIPYHLVVAAISQGAPIRMVLSANAAAEFVIAGQPDVKTMDDLAGKRIANSLPGGDTVVLAALDKAGMSPQDVNLVTLRDSPAKAAALLAGRVDAATLEYIDYERLRAKEPNLTLVSRQVDVFPPYPSTVWAVGSKWAEDNRALLQSLVDGMLTGYETLYTADGKTAWEEEAQKIEEGTEPALLNKTFDYHREIDFWPRRDAIYSPAAHDRVVRAYLESGGLEKAESYDRVWDASFWREAAKG
jgi:ABC-type nitrate/sulfonate/bicarbonate transport system substrate-binding protein